MIEPMAIYVQFPRGECTIYLRQQGRASHKFHVYIPSNLAYLEWRHFCEFLGRDPNTYPCIGAADWLEAGVKIQEVLDLSEKSFHVAPPRLDYVYIKGGNTALKNTPRYTIQEVTGTHRAVSVDTNRRLNSEQAQTLVKEVEKSLLFQNSDLARGFQAASSVPHGSCLEYTLQARVIRAPRRTHRNCIKLIALAVSAI